MSPKVNISTMVKAAIESIFFMVCLFSEEGEDCIKGRSFLLLGLELQAC